LYDSTLLAAVGGATINDGRLRSVNGWRDQSAGLASAANDSRAALMNAHFRYAVDGPGGVVESGAQVFVSPDQRTGGGRGFTAFDANSRLVDQTRIPMASVGNRLSLQSSNPLLAYWDSSGAGSAYINIATHDLQIGGTSLAYTGGSITGLAASTTYYVYVEDPTFAAGTVTYLTTTSARSILSSLGRYYVGKITTPASGGGGTSGSAGGAGGEVPT
nr:hypothetical protein [Gemmatimonadaceae bacterium]